MISRRGQVKISKSDIKHLRALSVNFNGFSIVAHPDGV
jgi:hypothetical protein